MRARLAFIALLIGSPLLSAEESHRFQIGDTIISPTEVVDARGLPEMDGSAGIMITFDAAGAAKLEQASRKSVGKPLPIMLDGKILMAPIIREPLRGGSVLITGLKVGVQEASLLAKQISGKPPLPDSLEEEDALETP